MDLSKWHVDNVCFLGDAAHAIFPFYGAGLNSGLEDVTAMASLIEKYKTRFETDDLRKNVWETIFEEF